MAFEVTQPTARQLYKTINFISYKEKVEAVDYSPPRLEKDLITWLTKAVQEAAGISGTIDWGDIQGTLSNQTDLQAALDAKSNTGHTHVEADITDLDKYTQAQVDTLLTGKANTVHTHVEADITDLDKYTQAQVDALLSGKANTIHTHVEADITDLDKYTQAEVDALVAGLAPIVHTHTLADVTDSGALAALNTVGNPQIDANAVTNDKLALMFGPTFKGRLSGSGAPQDLSTAQATSMLDSFAGSIKGLVPVSPGGTGYFLRTDGQWASPAVALYELSVKDDALLATTTHLDAVTGNTWTAAGSGVGKTLTAGAVGVLTIDGVATSLGDRVLIKDEDGSSANLTDADNGIYEVTTEGDGGTVAVLTRVTDFDGNPAGEVGFGSYVAVTAGSTNANTQWVIRETAVINVDIDPILFTLFEGDLPKHADTHVNGPDSIQDATAAQRGLMTLAYASKLDGIEAGATADQTAPEIEALLDAYYGGVDWRTQLSDSEVETAYNNQVDVVSQVDAEAGTSNTVYRWTPERIAQAIAALESPSITDHGALGGLGDDDHTQYHTDARALAWLGTRSTSDLPEGSNLYNRVPAGGTAGQVLEKIDGTDYNLQWATPSTGVTDHGALTGLTDDDHTQYHTDARATTWLGTKDLGEIGNVSVSGVAQGAILYYNGSNWVHLAAGTSGHYLQTNGTGANPSWTAVSATDANAIHDNVAAEINAITLKGTLVPADVFLIEDSAASFAKKKTTLQDILDEVSTSPGVTRSIESFNITNATSQSATSGSYFAIKVIPAFDITVSQMSCYVTSANASTAYMGIYDNSGNLLDEASVSTGSTGVRQGSLSGSVTLSQGAEYYFALLEGSGSPNFASKPIFSLSSIGRSAYVSGTPSAMPDPISGGATTTGFWLRAST